MTINQVIEQVSRLSPGAVEDRDIAQWILALDGKLFTQLQMPEDTERPKEWPKDGDVQMVAAPPYDGVYVLYAQLKIEFYRKDYEEYNNTATAYNDAMNEYRKAYRREHPPEPEYISTL